MENMSENGYPIFGSSEFQHGKENFYHPSQVFSGTDFQPMLIGAGYYQSLSHAITLASIEDSMKVQKAALNPFTAVVPQHRGCRSGLCLPLFRDTLCRGNGK